MIAKSAGLLESLKAQAGQNCAKDDGDNSDCCGDADKVAMLHSTLMVADLVLFLPVPSVTVRRTVNVPFWVN